MSTRHDFSEKVIQNFCNQYEITLNLTAEQTGKLTADGKTPLLFNQITDIANQLCPDDVSLKKFIEERSSELHPVSLSTYIMTTVGKSCFANIKVDKKRVIPN